MNRRRFFALVAAQTVVYTVALHFVEWPFAPTPVETTAKAAAPTAQAASSGRIRDITFDDIKLELKKDEAFKPEVLTPAVKKLEGATVRVRGYMLPSFQESGLKQFVLMRDNMECCFGPGAALYDCIIVEMVGDATASFSVRPISVEGKFSLRELLGPNGKQLAIYHMDGHEVK
jgi:hypothetical protein